MGPYKTRSCCHSTLLPSPDFTLSTHYSIFLHIAIFCYHLPKVKNELFFPSLTFRTNSIFNGGMMVKSVSEVNFCTPDNALVVQLSYFSLCYYIHAPFIIQYIVRCDRRK